VRHGEEQCGPGGSAQGRPRQAHIVTFRVEHCSVLN
jgi:hypothetical protein